MGPPRALKPEWIVSTLLRREFVLEVDAGCVTFSYRAKSKNNPDAGGVSHWGEASTQEPERSTIRAWSFEAWLGENDTSGVRLTPMDSEDAPLHQSAERDLVAPGNMDQLRKTILRLMFAARETHRNTLAGVEGPCLQI